MGIVFLKKASTYDPALSEGPLLAWGPQYTERCRRKASSLGVMVEGSVERAFTCSEFSYVRQTSAILEWGLPKISGGRKDTLVE